MPAKRNAIMVAGLAVAALFLFAMIQLLAARFEGGESYPRYSSLLAGPQGMRLLYDSLDAMPGVSVSRHRARFTKLKGRPSAILLGGFDYYSYRGLTPSDAHELEDVLRDGSRVILTFEPIQVDRSAVFDATRDKFSSEKDRDARRLDRQKEVAYWDVLPFVAPRPESPNKSSAVNDDDTREDQLLTTQLRFQLRGSAWKILQSIDGAPTIIERPLNGGTLVMVANGAILTNRALLEDPQTILISRLLAQHRDIVFDESHLGLIDSASTMGLARKYGLTVPILMLIGLFALFIWQNSQSLVPPPSLDTAAPFIQGRDAASGFVNLLKLAIPAHGLIQACYQQWQRSAASRLPMNETRASRLRELIHQSIPQSTRPLQDYRSISLILTEKKIS